MSLRSACGALVALFASRTLASCAYGTSLFPRAEGGEVKVNTFGYAGSIGPANWHLLDVAANQLCATGAHQSPIDMTAGTFSVIPASDVTIDIPDFTEGTEFENLGTTVEVIAKGGEMTIGGVTHTLAQFHFHLPSEHLDNGLSHAMEMHMVWEGPEGQIAVIGTYIDITEGSVAEAPASVPSNVTAPAAPVAAPPAAAAPVAAPVAAPPAAAHPVAPVAPVAPVVGETAVHHPAPVLVRPGSLLHSRQVRRDLAREQSKARRQEAPAAAAPAGVTALLETVLGKVEEIATPGTKVETEPLIMSEVVNIIKAGSFQTYAGSLTTPPCSEGVRWLVSDQSLAINLSTFLKARSVIGFNSRFPQNFLSLAPPASAVVSA